MTTLIGLISRAALAGLGLSEAHAQPFLDQLDRAFVAIDANLLGEEEVFVADGTIAVAAVKTLNATPVELVAAPAAGKYIEVIGVHWFLDFGTAAYDGAAAGEDLAVKYTDASGAQVCDFVDHSGFGDATADAHSVCRPIQVVPVAAAALVAHILVGEWFAAAGDSPLKFQVHYRVRTLDIAGA